MWTTLVLVVWALTLFSSRIHHRKQGERKLTPITGLGEVVVGADTEATGGCQGWMQRVDAGGGGGSFWSNSASAGYIIRHQD